MNEEELGSQLEQLIIGANDILSEGVITVQEYLYSQLVKILKDLKLDDQGYIIQSSENRTIIQDAINAIDDKVQSSSYKTHVENYLSTVPSIDQLNVTYFEALSDAFKPNRQYLASLQKSTVGQIEDLLFNSGFESQIKIPLSAILNQNINSGGSFTALLEQVKQYVKGTPELDGRLLSYTKTITKSTLFDYSRAFQQSVSSDLGLTWYNYSGGLMDKSRQFCIDHAGGYFSQAEVESWADQDWAGKRDDTTASSIFIYAGGWNCGHSIIPVDESTVPAEDIQAAKDGGFI